MHPSIVLTTVNARYIHSAFGLRYLLANMGPLSEETVLREFTLETRAQEIAESLISYRARIIGFGIYIWNVDVITAVVSLIKTVSPETIIVIGGPELSYEWQQQALFKQADFLIRGQADLAFGELCKKILDNRAPAEKILEPAPPPPGILSLPYGLYSQEDIDHRIIYVEASRGCPFKCEFCLSALDKTAVPFDIDVFLEQMDLLHRRGAWHFKFVDRTFNLKLDNTLKILEFFLARMDERLFLHFEVIPDRLPDRLRDVLRRFPPGSLQLEIGIQSFNLEVQALISRKQDNQKSRANLAWLREQTEAHLHVDLIAGLPGEDLSSFARGFDELVSLNPQEIQLGILKRLRGSPIIRHTESSGLRFSPLAPYEILQTSQVTYEDMQRIKRFARYWEMLANSGRFPATLALILGESPFARFMKLSDCLFHHTGRVHAIALRRLFCLLYDMVRVEFQLPDAVVVASLEADYERSGLKGKLSTLVAASKRKSEASKTTGLSRQSRFK